MIAILFLTLAIVTHQSCQAVLNFNLYYTEQQNGELDHHCLYYMSNAFRDLHQINSYCLRSDLGNDFINNVAEMHQRWTFGELKNRSITALQLLLWTAPINLVERYQEYLQDALTTHDALYYNCTFPWFGERCEFTFDQSRPIPQNELIDRLTSKQSSYNRQSLPQAFPCYTHVKCNRSGVENTSIGLCLDWREICDGKFDCYDGEQDEEHCWQLELNECDNEKEFRCRNGLCIDRTFFHDNRLQVDCLDGSDESIFERGINKTNRLTVYYKLPCYGDSHVWCEERSCHWGSRVGFILTCGTSDCFNPFLLDCRNGRHNLYLHSFFVTSAISDQCRTAMHCYSGVLFFDPSHAKLCENSDNRINFRRVKALCPPLISIDHVFKDIQLVYYLAEEEAS
jgi:hypothetical protein